MDKTAKMIIALVPDEVMHKMPFFVRGHATTDTVAKIAKEHPELYAQAEQCDVLEGELKEQLSKILPDIFDQKMRKHGYNSTRGNPFFAFIGYNSGIDTLTNQPVIK